MYKMPRIKIIALRIITPVIIFFAIISTFVAGFFCVYTRTYVKGLSMSPTLNQMYAQNGEQDVIYINRFAKAEVNDIVVLDLRSHASFGDYAVKRLVAVEGDIVNIIFNTTSMQYELIVNGKLAQARPYSNDFMGNNTFECFKQYVLEHQDDTTRVLKNNNEEIEGVIIKSGEIFVLGDNWNQSKDSSLVGPISDKMLVGRVDFIIRPTENEFFTILKRIF